MSGQAEHLARWLAEVTRCTVRELPSRRVDGCWRATWSLHAGRDWRAVDREVWHLRRLAVGWRLVQIVSNGKRQPLYRPFVDLQGLSLTELLCGAGLLVAAAEAA